MNNRKPKEGFGGPQRLKSRKQIQTLFSGAYSVFAFPVKLIWMVIQPVGDEGNNEKIFAGVSVSKRNFKRAVDRNRVKRLLRESYRLNKQELTEHMENKTSGLALFLIYVDKTQPTFEELQPKIAHLLKMLKDKTRELP